MHGAVKTLTYSIQRYCEHCLSMMVTCAVCSGDGFLVKPGPAKSVPVRCEACPTNKGCITCHGSGIIDEECTQELVLEPGQACDLESVVLAKRGHVSPRGEVGDVVVYFDFLTHPRFERRGFDVIVNVTTGFLDAILGCSIVIDGIYGMVDVVLPEGVFHGSYLKVEGQGICNPKLMTKGDLYLCIFVEFPSSLTARQRSMLDSVRRKWNEEEMETP